MKNQKRKRQNQKRRITNKDSTASFSNKDELWIYGKHPSFIALKKRRRKVSEILVTENSLSDLDNFFDRESLNNLRTIVEIVDNQKIELVVGKNQIHQGIAVRASKLKIKSQTDLLDELSSAKNTAFIPDRIQNTELLKNQNLIVDAPQERSDSKNPKFDFKSDLIKCIPSQIEDTEFKKLPTLLLLDQISDPQNIGAIIRSAVAFGVTKIIFCEHNSPKETGTMVKASAGMIEFVDLIVVTNLNSLIEKLKKIGYWCIGLAGEAKTTIEEIKDYKNVALVVGCEGIGLRHLVKKSCDILVKIKINEAVESLNASVASSIALYELSRTFQKK